MNLRNRFATILTTAVLAGSLVVGAQAQDNSITDTAAVEIKAGTFTATIEAQDFVAGNYSFFDEKVSSEGLVLTIINKTGSPNGWTVTTTATDYLGQTRGGEKIPFANTAVSGTTALTSIAGQEVGSGVNQSVSLASGGAATSPIISVTAADGAGQGEYKLGISALELTIPGGTLAQTYTSTLTVNIPTAP